MRKLAKETRPKISPTTVSRIENPETSGATGSPTVETLEALAQALNCPLCELLGESLTIEYRAGEEWPDALRGLLLERGGLVTPTERAFLTKMIAEDVRSEEFDDVEWLSVLASFEKSRVWKLIDRLIYDSRDLDEQPKLLTALESILALAIRGTEPQPEGDSK